MLVEAIFKIQTQNHKATRENNKQTWGIWSNKTIYKNNMNYCTYNAESFISGKAGMQNIAPPIPNTASEIPFSHKVLQFLKFKE